MKKSGQPLGMTASTDWFRTACLVSSETAARNALKQAGIDASEITGVVYVIPGLAAPHPIYYLGSALGLDENVDYMYTTAGGCVYGMTGFARAHDHLRLNPAGACLFVSIELNSGMYTGGIQNLIKEAATRGFDNFKGKYRGQLITAALFGDWASATVMLGSYHPRRSSLAESLPAGSLLPAIIDHRRKVVHNSHEHVGMELFDAGYMGYLSPALVTSAPQAMAKCAHELMKMHNVDRSQVSNWVIHPGGPAIVETLSKLLDLKDSDIAICREVYSQVGNIAACSAVEILRRTVEQYSQSAVHGQYIIGLAAGYGVTAHGVLFRWEKPDEHVIPGGLLTPNSDSPRAVTVADLDIPAFTAAI